jgi:hypothetical protein
MMTSGILTEFRTISIALSSDFLDWLEKKVEAPEDKNEPESNVEPSEEPDSPGDSQIAEMRRIAGLA